MNMVIHGIPVEADPALSREKVNALVLDVIQSWGWEGRELGKIELISSATLIHVCAYEKPSIWKISKQ